jgi:deoxyribose-phosphate aldolase
MAARTISRAELAATFDHSVLAPTATPVDVKRGCAVAAEAGTATVCVRPIDIADAVAALRGFPHVGVATVIGFPHGTTTSATKAAESAEAVARGATELDMVLCVGAAKAGDWAAVEADVAAVVRAAAGVPVKVILETAFLTEAEKRAAVRASVAGGAAFVKTSTGFASAGATAADVALMRAEAPAAVRVKASGGIRTLETALAMLAAGADRLGLSATEAILSEFDAKVGAGGRIELPLAGGAAPAAAAAPAGSY